MEKRDSRQKAQGIVAPQYYAQDLYRNQHQEQGEVQPSPSTGLSKNVSAIRAGRYVAMAGA
jgi:hypothetical protein